MSRRTPLSGIVATAALIAICMTPSRVAAQFRGDSELPPPDWKHEPGFESDVFSFARVRYRSWDDRGRFGDKWRIDYPDAEWNLAFRLEEMTSMKVDPQGIIVRLTPTDLMGYPFIYIIEPGGMQLLDSEVEALRNYLLNGGFLMVDDFWGDRQWNQFEGQIRRVFPNREIRDLPITHEIFNAAIPMKLEELPQIPNVGLGIESQWNGGITYESRSNPGAEDPHYRAILDDNERIMVLICHNTDLGDGWEREGENEYYFREFSEKKAFPLGINILFYAMTH